MKVYGQTLTFAGTEYVATPLLNGDNLGAISLTSSATAANAQVSGSPYQIVPMASGPVALNYSITYLDGLFTVKPAPLTITASSNTMVIGGPVPAITPSYLGFVNSETASNLTTQPTCTTTVTSSSAAGTHANADTCIGAADTNYTLTYVSGTMKVTYNVPTLFNQTAPNNSGASVPVKIQLSNYSGKNLSSPAITVTIVGFAPNPAPGVAPTGTFTYMKGDSGPMYQFNVKTTGYPPGTYTLSFTVTGDPNVHTVNFVIG
jgi:hypothetical protein